VRAIRLAATLPAGEDAAGVAAPAHLRRARAAGPMERDEGAAHPALGDGPGYIVGLGSGLGFARPALGDGPG
jgi:hypothetical protein